MWFWIRPIQLLLLLEPPLDSLDAFPEKIKLFRLTLRSFGKVDHFVDINEMIRSPLMQTHGLSSPSNKPAYC